MADENAQPAVSTAVIKATGPSSSTLPSLPSKEEPSVTMGFSILLARRRSSCPPPSPNLAPHKWGPCLCDRGSGEGHSTISVESRTWPGINKPGGVGRVTRRTIVEEQRYGEMVPLAYYDVKYVLGGSEKKILETYIQCVGREGKTARPACPRDLFTVEASEPIPRSRQSCEPSPSLPAKAKAARNPNPSPPLGFSKLMNARVVSQRDGKSAKMKRPKPCESSDAPLPPPVRRETKQPRDRDGGRDGSGEAKSDPPLRLAKLPKVAGCVKSKPPEAKVHITDLSEQERVVPKEVIAPLPQTRMAMLSGLIREVFHKNNTDKLTILKLKEGINRLVPADSCPFKDPEIDSAFHFLENEENKLMVSDGQVYLI
ncbi:unnamed protein product [Ascophyllum nodosum]